MQLTRKTLFSLTALLFGVAASGVNAQQGGAVKIPPTGKVDVQAANVVDFSSLPDVAPSGTKVRTNKFRPTIPIDLYNRLKSQGPLNDLGGGKGALEGINPLAATKIKLYEGLNQVQSADSGGTWAPSDCNGAVSPLYYVEITNAAIGVFTRGGTNKSIKPLSVFFGYTAQPLFDPQVKYDPVWNRWIASATAFPEDADHMYMYVSVSTTSSPLGAYYTYRINVAFNHNDFWDYQKIGLTQDAVLFDANVFNGNDFHGASLFCVAKALLYNGYGFSFPLFQNLGATLTLPIVQDQSATAYLIYDKMGTKTVGTYALNNASHGFDATLTAGPNVNIGVTQNYPRAAKQPGTTADIDTLDGRFPNNTVQVGNVIYATNCVDLAGFPVTNVIAINCATNTKVFQKFLFATSTSDDFNPQVAVNLRGDVAVAWSSTNWSATVGYPAIYINGKLAAGVFASKGKSIFNSLSAYTGGRWGDYSALNVDPVDGVTFWGVNQYSKQDETWGTKFYNISVN